MLARGAALLSAFLVTACGTSAHYSGAAPLSADSGSAPQALGARCTSGTSCASGFCLGFSASANAEDAGGLCSARCQTSADCGGNGYCRAEPASADGGPSALDGGACFRTCASATDCGDGIPCIWQAPLDAGFCQPISPPDVLCREYAEAGLGPCETCLANASNCCALVAACVEDVPCAKLETCAGTCASSFATSGIPSAMALGQCAADKCGAVCN